MSDFGIQAIGPALTTERLEPVVDQKIQSNGGFAGVKQAVDRQMRDGVTQAEQRSDARLNHNKPHGGFVLDAETRQVYYRTEDPVTGRVQKMPSEAQMRMVAAMKEDEDRKLSAAQKRIAETQVPIPGQILDADA